MSHVSTVQKVTNDGDLVPLRNSQSPMANSRFVETLSFQFDGENYLVIVDYYSKFTLIEKMPTYCKAKAVVETTTQSKEYLRK